MKICVLTFTRVVDDPRVRRHIDALSQAYEVSSCGYGPPPPGVVEHWEIPEPEKPYIRSPAALWSLLTRRSDNYWRNMPDTEAARRLLSKAEFSVLLTNDIESLPVGLEVAGQRPVLADLHEYAPLQREDSALWRLLVQEVNTALCRKYLPRATAVTTVAPGITDRYEQEFSVQVRTITNACAFRAPEPRPVNQPMLAVHTGAAIPNRGLDLMIQGIAMVPNITFDLYLVSVGFHKYMSRLRSLASETTNVRVLDPVPPSEVPQVLDKYDMGIYVLPPRGFNKIHSLPNKFFDFIQSGLAIVVGPSPEMAPIVEHYGMGTITDGFSPNDLRRRLSNISVEQCESWKVASCRAAGECNSDANSAALREIVEEIASG